MNYKNTFFSLFLTFALGGTSITLAMLPTVSTDKKEQKRIDEPVTQFDFSKPGERDSFFDIISPQPVAVPQVPNNNQIQLNQNNSQKKSTQKNTQQRNNTNNKKQIVPAPKKEVKQVSQVLDKQQSKTQQKKTEQKIHDNSHNSTNNNSHISHHKIEEKVQQTQPMLESFEEQIIKRARASSQHSQKNQHLSLYEQNKLQIQVWKKNENVEQEKMSRLCQGVRSKGKYFVAAAKINVMQDDLDLVRKGQDNEFTKDIKERLGSIDNNLIYALEDNDIKSMELLLNKDNINATDKYGSSLLHYASIHSTPEMVQLLLDRGADINAKDDIKQTPLFIACRDGKKEIVKILLERGADVDDHFDKLFKNLKSCFEQDIAIEADNIERFMLCPSVSHNIYPRADEGYLPLHAASYNGNEEIVDLLLNNKIKKADVNVKSNNHVTPLHMAAQQGHTSIVQKLSMVKGVNCDAETVDTFSQNSFCGGHFGGKVTPLILATVYGKTEVVKALAPLSNVNYQVGPFKATALHFASSEGHSEMVKTLTANGADPNLPVWGKHTAADVAHYYGKKDVAGFLTDTMDRLRQKLTFSLSKNKREHVPIEIRTNSVALQKAITIQLKSNIRADLPLIEMSAVEEQKIKPTFEFSCSLDNGCVSPGVYYRNNGQIIPISLDITKKMKSNHLSDLNYDKCEKMRIAEDFHHNFSETIEKINGALGRVVVDIADMSAIADKKKKFDLYVTIPGKMDMVQIKEGQRKLLQSEQGVFEYKVRKKLYDSYGSCYHRFFNLKGSVGAQGFGAEFRKKEEKKKKLESSLTNHNG